jgi:hypothetical protein
MLKGVRASTASLMAISSHHAGSKPYDRGDDLALHNEADYEKGKDFVR